MPHVELAISDRIAQLGGRNIGFLNTRASWWHSRPERGILEGLTVDTTEEDGYTIMANGLPIGSQGEPAWLTQDSLNGSDGARKASESRGYTHLYLLDDTRIRNMEFLGLDIRRFRP